MNASQLILLFASFIVLTGAILLVNKTSLESENERIRAKYQIIALTEARNLYEEIKSKIYDEKIFLSATLNRDSLTSASNLGPDGEVYPDFDDIDDYNNYTRSLAVSQNVVYTLKVRVSYVREDNPEILSSTSTFYKLVRIVCYDQNQSQVFELKQINSIW